jgi:glycerol-3-phosphate acyltransferase PlsY
MLYPIDWPFALPYAAALVIGYLLGSIPFGLILTRCAGTPDIRSVGSGNIGATNVLRTGNKALAAATLIGDTLKGTAAVLAARCAFGPDAAMAAAVGALLGHVFPVWLHFKGGKGVATYIGLLIGLAWPAALAFCLIWLATAALTRYSSLAGLLASAAMPPMLWIMGDDRTAVLFLPLAALVWIMHRANIARLLDGTEHKIGRSAPAADL